MRARFGARVPGALPTGGVDIDAMSCLIPLPRHATRSSSRSQSAYTVFLFIHSLHSSNENSDFRHSNRAIGDDRRKLLGKHIWKEFLLNPSEGEKGRTSGVFYSIYQNIRDIQREGKRERLVKCACEEPNFCFLRLEANRLRSVLNQLHPNSGF